MPAAEVTITPELVRRLVDSQATAALPDAASLPLRRAAQGWDSELWRLGAKWAARLPRRSLAAPLVLNEQRALAVLAPGIEAAGVRVPAPIVHGAPAEGFPWAWSVVPWFEGESGLEVPRVERAHWAGSLAAALRALHRPAPADHPVNPVRGVPLRVRAEVVGERFELLRARSAAPTAMLAIAQDAWESGLRAAEWSGAPVWIHGDLHPGNLVAVGSRLEAIIDFGDVTGGDPAYDLAIAWLAFDDAGREVFIAATEDAYPAATWVRARAWAAAVSAMLLANSDDNPAYAELGMDGLEEVARTADS
jgi:aminoglycoside phosphotransferase (APT) family kinase protein